MRVGPIQRDILFFLSRCDREIGAYIGSTCRAEELRGLDLSQVERALDGLMRRRLVRKEGIRFVPSYAARAWVFRQQSKVGLKPEF